MKRVSALFCLLAFVTINALSVAPPKKISCILGAGISSIGGDSDSWKSTPAFEAGICMPVHDFSETLSLRAGLLGSIQGAKWEDSYYGQTMSGKVTVIYAVVPVVVRYRLKNNFYGEAGIQPGLLLSAKDKYNGQTDDFKDSMNKFDLALRLGAGYEFSNNFGVGLQIVPGLTNINSEGSAKDRNFLVALRGTYTFGK